MVLLLHYLAGKIKDNGRLVLLQTCCLLMNKPISGLTDMLNRSSHLCVFTVHFCKCGKQRGLVGSLVALGKHGNGLTDSMQIRCVAWDSLYGIFGQVRAQHAQVHTLLSTWHSALKALIVYLPTWHFYWFFVVQFKNKIIKSRHTIFYKVESHPLFLTDAYFSAKSWP